MLKRIIKNRYVTYITSFLLFALLRMIYATLRYKSLTPQQQLTQLMSSTKNVCFLWHQHLAIAPGILRHMQNIHAVASPHSDGKLIGNIIQLMGHKVIWGSSNRSPTAAIKQIYQLLETGANIIITPDGPKGPAQQFNSNAHKIAARTNSNIILFACNTEQYLQLNSWDKMRIPLPFSTVTYKLVQFDITACDTQENRLLIEQKLTQIGKDCEQGSDMK